MGIRLGKAGRDGGCLGETGAEELQTDTSVPEGEALAAKLVIARWGPKASRLSVLVAPVGLAIFIEQGKLGDGCSSTSVELGIPDCGPLVSKYGATLELLLLALSLDAGR